MSDKRIPKKGVSKTNSANVPTVEKQPKGEEDSDPDNEDNQEEGTGEEGEVKATSSTVIHTVKERPKTKSLDSLESDSVASWINSNRQAIVE